MYVSATVPLFWGFFYVDRQPTSLHRPFCFLPPERLPRNTLHPASTHTLVPSPSTVVLIEFSTVVERKRGTHHHESNTKPYTALEVLFPSTTLCPERAFSTPLCYTLLLCSELVHRSLPGSTL